MSLLKMRKAKTFGSQTHVAILNFRLYYTFRHGHAHTHTYSISEKKLKYVRCSMVMVLWWCSSSTLLVRSWCARGLLESSIGESVRYGTQFGLLYVSAHTYMQYVDTTTGTGTTA